jgi:hypothetical protein
VTAIAAGSGHSVALKSNGTVVAWGENDFGQTTVPIAAQSGVTAIAAGGLHTVVLKNGAVLAWGSNAYGQTNVPVAAKSGATAIAAGWSHTLARIGKVIASVTLGSLNQAYNGSARSATATTSPAGLTVDFTYNGSPTAPTYVGSYTVIGTINDPNYQGTASNTLVILQGPATITPLTDVKRLTNGAFQFAFTNTPGAPFTILVTKDISLGLSNWDVLVGVTETSPGNFQFTDPQATTNKQRFYRIRSP